MQGGIAIGVLCVLTGGVAAQWAAWRMRLPPIVLLFALRQLRRPEQLPIDIAATAQRVET